MYLGLSAVVASARKLNARLYLTVGPDEMLDYLLANKDWVFDGWGVAAIGFLITAVTAGGAWLYKRVRSSPNPPQPISIPHPIEVQLLPPKKEEHLTTEPNSEVAGIVGRFNKVLSLINQRRTYDQYTIARLARIMQLNSVSDLEAIFLGKHEPSFDFIDKFCNCFGVYKEWLIDGEITPYYNEDNQTRMPLDYFDEIKRLNPELVFLVMSNSSTRDTLIVLKFFDWQYKILCHTCAISDHVGGGGQAQIFSMYCLIKALENEGMFTRLRGRRLNEEDFRQLENGNIFPRGVLESGFGYAKYWWHDFTDVYHKSWIARSESWIADHYEELYGKGFLFAQEVVRYYLKDHDKGKASQPRIHVPEHCTTCRALSSKEADCSF